MTDIHQVPLDILKLICANIEDTGSLLSLRLVNKAFYEISTQLIHLQNKEHIYYFVGKPFTPYISYPCRLYNSFHGSLYLLPNSHYAQVLSSFHETKTVKLFNTKDNAYKYVDNKEKQLNNWESTFPVFKVRLATPRLYPQVKNVFKKFTEDKRLLENSKKKPIRYRKTNKEEINLEAAVWGVAQENSSGFFYRSFIKNSSELLLKAENSNVLHCGYTDDGRERDDDILLNRIVGVFKRH